MAIAVKLDDLLHDRRMTLTELADRIGMTLANLSILKTGKARAIRFSTLDAICEALSCQPGDIRLLHRDRLLLPRPAGRHAAGGPRLAGPLRPGLRAVRGDGLLARPGAARKTVSQRISSGQRRPRPPYPDMEI
jgi:putative transcriptional regulator